jgi:hypothetical protein
MSWCGHLFCAVVVAVVVVVVVAAVAAVFVVVAAAAVVVVVVVVVVVATMLLVRIGLRKKTWMRTFAIYSKKISTFSWLFGIFSEQIWLSSVCCGSI